MWIPTNPYNNLPELPPHFTETIKIFRQTIQSRVALERLHQAVNLLPNNEILIQTIPILEAQASSEIENIVTTTDNLFKFLDADTQADAATKEALRYRQALWKGMDSLKRCPLSLRTMTAVSSTLRGSKVSVRKLDGTCIASASSGQVIYTPPAGEALYFGKFAQPCRIPAFTKRNGSAGQNGDCALSVRSHSSFFGRKRSYGAGSEYSLFSRERASQPACSVFVKIFHSA